MKNIAKFFALAGVLLLAFAGCKEDKLMVFEGDNNIYFQTTKWPSGGYGYTGSLRFDDGTLTFKIGATQITQVVDSLNISMAFLNPAIASDTTYLSVSILGKPQPYERKVGWKIVDAGDAVEGIDFKVLDAFIPANATRGGIVVEIFRENLVDGKVFNVKFQLTENENFKVDYPAVPFSATDPKVMSTIEMKLRWTDGLEPPSPWWDASTTASCYPFLGAYSLRKLFVIHDYLGVEWEDIYNADGTGKNDFAAKGSIYGTLLFKWLIRYEEQNGEPYKDEDGTAMKAGAQYY